jgi:rod shape determining protein RodA
MIDRRYFDWVSFFLTLILVGTGLLFVFSATYRPDRPLSIFFKKQLIGVLSGFVLYFLFCNIDIRRLARWGFFLYFVAVILLGYTIIGGWIGMGAKRWISLYVIRFQPAELIKLLFPLFLGYYFHLIEHPQRPFAKIPFKYFLVPLMVLGITFLLILKQPDLGTALIVLFSGSVLFWYLGLSRIFFLAVALSCALTAPFLWNVLKPYQQKRILVLLGYGDARKERYQVEQSKIAIGSGGIVGKGILRGTQNKLDFLPEDHTDFIFSVVCEELGFFGALIIILLFGLLFVRILFVLGGVQTLFEGILGIGFLIHILLSFCINLGMVTGILPTVGIPLPLFSYGISNLWITLASLGCLNNIAIRRFYY